MTLFTVRTGSGCVAVHGFGSGTGVKTRLKLVERALDKAGLVGHTRHRAFAWYLSVACDADLQATLDLVVDKFNKGKA